MASGIFMYRHIPVSYSDSGNGNVVVLLHGFAETSDVWNEQIRFLHNHCRIIAPNLPPAGHPSSAVYQLASSIENIAAAVAALIKSIAQQPVILLGHSMGGYVTLAVAEKYPELLKAFGLVHSTAFADTDEKKETRRKGIDFIRKNGAAAFFKTAAPALFSSNSIQQMPELIQQNIKTGILFAPEILVAGYEAMMARPGRTQVLSGSRMPVLFIIGMEDKAAPVASILQQVHLPDVSYFHILNNVAHMGMWEAADQVNSIILKFTEDCG